MTPNDTEGAGGDQIFSEVWPEVRVNGPEAFSLCSVQVDQESRNTHSRAGVGAAWGA